MRHRTLNIMKWLLFYIILLHRNKKLECPFQSTGNALTPLLYVDDGPGWGSLMICQEKQIFQLPNTVQWLNESMTVTWFGPWTTGCSLPHLEVLEKLLGVSCKKHGASAPLGHQCCFEAPNVAFTYTVGKNQHYWGPQSSQQSSKNYFLSKFSLDFMVHNLLTESHNDANLKLETS